MIDVNIQEVASVSEVASSKCEGKKHDVDDCKDVLHVLIHERDRMPTCFCSFFAGTSITFDRKTFISIAEEVSGLAKLCTI